MLLRRQEPFQETIVNQIDGKKYGYDVSRNPNQLGDETHGLISQHAMAEMMNRFRHQIRSIAQGSVLEMAGMDDGR